ncbi:MAG: hypothetical protein Q8Q09_25370 [Deltaproteobacteria bacterium]|nr:hypothetical protein [Deltaproteobacteria bacterium]
MTDFRADGWARLGHGAIRGATLGPIESSAHPNVGYGTAASANALDELATLGCNWVSITPFGRQWDLQHTEIHLDFEQPFAANRLAVLRVIEQAHQRHLRVLLVPHLWIDRPGLWRGEIDPGSESRWAEWFASYTRFVLAWAQVAQESHAEMLSIGVEMKSSSGTRVPQWIAVIEQIRRVYGGMLTYSANWDEESHVGFWDRLDVVGINAFYPLAEQPGAGLDVLRAGATQRANSLGQWARREQRPVMFTEFGYTARPDPAVRPWEWPDSMVGVRVDTVAQAVAYRALLEAFVPQRWFVGGFVWRYYANAMDASQEASHGFSPRLREGEDVLRSIYALPWASDGDAARDVYEQFWSQPLRAPWQPRWRLTPESERPLWFR